ncbi:MAG TPA: prolyl oligopeptidase family serine peptidase, partial [Kofleriaceae bacterium]|nr:prolyl oligopeptidase family serine peptidase [Kofleriaceae bacterium]
GAPAGSGPAGGPTAGGPDSAGPAGGPTAPDGKPLVDPTFTHPHGGASMTADAPVPPIAAVRPVTNTYHGVDVVDRYQWLEGDTDEVKAWSDAENRWSRSILDKLPGLDTLRGEIRAYLTAPLTYYGDFAPAGGKVFALRRLPTAQQRDLVVMASPEAAADATVVLDPTAGGDAHRAIDWYVPSPDGMKLAVSISEGGSEAGTLHIVGLDGKDVEPPIPNVQRGTGGGDAVWRPDGKVLYYTRYPAAGEKPAGESDFWMQVWAHTLGTPGEHDRYEMGKDLPKIAEIKLDADARGRVLASVQEGDGGIFRHYLRAPTGGWKQLDDWSDGITTMTLAPSGDVFAVSVKGSPRGRILRLSGKAPSLRAAKVIVPEGDDSIVTSFPDDTGILATKDRLFVTVQQGGPTALRAYGLDGKAVPVPGLPPIATVETAPKPLGDDLMVGVMTYVKPWTWYRLTPKGDLTAIDAVSPKPPGSLDGWEVRRELATSKDGTKVPVNIVWKTGTPQDGTTPCIVTGYGGFGISTTPAYEGSLQPLLSRGVCFVEVNMRGGGEFGEAWHQAGMLTHKQNVFDDFAAGIEYVQGQRYTSPERTIIMGGSNGGLLMGAIITQHPELEKAAVSRVGIYDMLRNELTTNGSYNTSEYGSVADKAQFEALYAYSPYHHVVKGTRYPAVLFTTGANDPRVAPWHSRKMVAALQEAQEGSAPILLRTSANAGHGIGTSLDDRIDEIAHVDAFVLWQAGVAVE